MREARNSARNWVVAAGVDMPGRRVGEDTAIGAAGMGFGDRPVEQILGHPRRVPVQRVAISSAPGHAVTDHSAGVQQFRVGRQGRQGAQRVAGLDLGGGGAAVMASEEAMRRERGRAAPRPGRRRCSRSPDSR
ncbi:MAG: hypothetical protein CML68_11300 [Rhodobacteraceae bacterium]|nr:hypothetical protein [Paracoccaceae bacterium]